MTFTDFERLPNPPSGHYELHDGQLIIVTPRTKSQMQVRQALFDSLSGLRGRGFITVAFSFRPALDEYRQLDIGFVVADRWAKDKAEYFTGAAEFAVSLDDWIGETQNACLDHGGRSWAVDSERQTTTVTTPHRKAVTYDRSSVVPLSEPFSGNIEVAASFDR